MASADNSAPGLSARRAAVETLVRVCDRLQPLDEAVAAVLPRARLAPRDAAFARAIAMAVLRRYGEIAHVLAAFMAKPLDARAGAARAILQAGAAELLFLKTPAHAAVDAANGLAEAMRVGHFKALINAVLRRVSAEGPGLLDPVQAGRRNTPDWLFARWSAAYGAAAADAIAAAHLIEPPLDLSPRDPNRPFTEDLHAERLPTGTLRRSGGGRIEDLPGFAEGAWWVQDAAAALPAKLLGDVRGKPVLDLCAAPGGKTAELAAAGAAVTAVERSAPRAARLRENLARLRLAADVVEADVLTWRPQTPAPLVLLDAPCSATGTIRRHPDVLFHKTEADIARLADMQRDLLDAAAAMTAPGGTLVYAVCSLEPEEGPGQIAGFLARHAAFERVPVAPGEIGGLSGCLTPDGDLRTLPFHLAEKGGMDGFYACRLGWAAETAKR